MHQRKIRQLTSHLRIILLHLLHLNLSSTERRLPLLTLRAMGRASRPLPTTITCSKCRLRRSKDKARFHSHLTSLRRIPRIMVFIQQANLRQRLTNPPRRSLALQENLQPLVEGHQSHHSSRLHLRRTKERHPPHHLRKILA